MSADKIKECSEFWTISSLKSKLNSHYEYINELKQYGSHVAKLL